MDSLKFWLDDTDKLFLPEAGMSGVVCDLLTCAADPPLVHALPMRHSLHSISTVTVMQRAARWPRSSSH